MDTTELAAKYQTMAAASTLTLSEMLAAIPILKRYVLALRAAEEQADEHMLTEISDAEDDLLKLLILVRFPQYSKHLASVPHNPDSNSPVL